MLKVKGELMLISEVIIVFLVMNFLLNSNLHIFIEFCVCLGFVIDFMKGLLESVIWVCSIFRWCMFIVILVGL